MMKTKNLYGLNYSLIVQYRRENKMSQTEFGELLGGIAQQTVARWEKGTVFPDPKNVAKIAKVLGVEIKDLYLIDPTLAHSMPEYSADIVLLLYSFRKRLQESYDQLDWIDTQMMKILTDDCIDLISRRLRELDKDLANK